MAKNLSLLLCIACGLWGAQSVSPVQKVLGLIDEMAVKVTADRDKAVEEFTAFSQYAFKADRDKMYALKKSAENIEAFNAAIVDSQATIASHEEAIPDISAKISEASSNLDEAIALRAKEHEDFLAEEKSLVSDIEALETVMETLAQQASFAQLSPKAKSGIQALREGLARMADSEFVMNGPAKKVAAFLQAREEGEAGNPGTDVLNVVKEKFQDSLKNSRRKEQETQAAHDSMVMDSENEIKGLKKELSVNTKGKATASESLAQAQKDLAVETKGEKEDQAFKQELKRDYDIRARDFEVEFKDSNAELTALSQAKAILEKKFASLLESGVHSTVRRVVSVNDAQKIKALRLIQQLGQRLHSTAMISLAYRASADPFVKVRGMVQDMIEKLMQEAAEAADQKAFCDEEQGKSRKSKEEKDMSLAKTTARIEKAQSAIATLSEQKTMLSKEVANLDSEMKEATEIRAGEKAVFDKTEKDLSESVDACGAAIQVLRDYYEGGSSLMQVSTGAKTQGGGGILNVLDYAASDFSKQLSDIRVAEREALDKFDSMALESKQLRAVKEVEIKSKVSEMKSLKTALADYNEDKDGVSSELQAVVDYLAELKPKCEAEAPPSYAEKKAARDAEIQGLKEALQILE
jgi:predicted  nucleic acid-binding Zn-ribbon protein